MKSTRNKFAMLSACAVLMNAHNDNGSDLPGQAAAAAEAAKAQKAAEKAAAAEAKRLENEAKAAAKKAENELKAAEKKAAAEAKKAENEAKKAAKAAEAEAKKLEAEAKKAEREAAREASKAARQTVKQNDVSRPKAGTITGEVWDKADELSAATKAPATIAALIDALPGIAEATVRTQYARWRKFHGVEGRLVAAKAAEEPATGENAGEQGATQA